MNKIIEELKENNIFNHSERKPSKTVLDFIARILFDYKMYDWNIIFWDIEGENECVESIKTIYLYNYRNNKKIKGFFLHELAHVLQNNEAQSHGHYWRKNFDNLCRKYLKINAVQVDKYCGCYYNENRKL